jgi:hypothetical protein
MQPFQPCPSPNVAENPNVHHSPRQSSVARLLTHKLRLDDGLYQDALVVTSSLQNTKLTGILSSRDLNKTSGAILRAIHGRFVQSSGICDGGADLLFPFFQCAIQGRGCFLLPDPVPSRRCAC